MDVFFAFTYVRTRSVHSFPTRRSSDLVACRAAARLTLLAFDARLPYDLAPLGVLLGVKPPLLRQVEQGQDRKSTRLNSSHSSISYAVFCLKKKSTNP